MVSRIIPEGKSSSYIRLTNSANIGEIMAAYTIATHPVRDFDVGKLPSTSSNQSEKKQVSEVLWSYGMQTTPIW